MLEFLEEIDKLRIVIVLTKRWNCEHDACRNQEAVAELLVKAGADVNFKNAVGLFPLAVAAAIGNHSTLRVLVKSEDINLNDKVTWMWSYIVVLMCTVCICQCVYDVM